MESSEKYWVCQWEGVWRTLPLEQRLWAMGQPSASAQHVPGRVRVWYSLPHCPSAASPGTRFLSEKPPSQAPSRSWWSSALTLLFSISPLFWSCQIKGNITIAPSQTGVSPPSLVLLPLLSGQWAGQGWVRPGQTSRAERISLFLFSFSFLLPFPSAAVGISSLSPSQDACGPDVVA